MMKMTSMAGAMMDELRERNRERKELADIQYKINCIGDSERAAGVTEETEEYLALHDRYYRLRDVHEEARAQRRLKRLGL